MELANTMQDADARKLTAPMQMVFSDVVKKFDTGTVALDGIDLNVERGDFVAVVGPSGCGKSTLLRMAAGLERPTSGAVALDTESVGFIFQEPTLLPWRTVQANVELSAELGGGDQAARKLRADEAIRAVGPCGLCETTAQRAVWRNEDACLVGASAHPRTCCDAARRTFRCSRRDDTTGDAGRAAKALHRQGVHLDVHHALGIRGRVPRKQGGRHDRPARTNPFGSWTSISRTRVARNCATTPDTPNTSPRSRPVSMGAHDDRSPCSATGHHRTQFRRSH